MNEIPFLVGPTASGKTEVSLIIALKLGAEIVGADSRQVFKYLDIGTAKPTTAERKAVPHHMIDILEPNDHYSAGDYARDARMVIEEIKNRGRIPLVVGGSGLYIKALIEGLSSGLGRDLVLRRKLQVLARTMENNRLHVVLSRIDPETAARIKPNDKQRILRALELIIIHERPLAEIHKLAGQNPGLKAAMVGIRLPREVLYRRIETRVEKMLADGLVDEVKRLLASGISPGCNAMNSLGYKECTAYLEGKISCDRMVYLLKRNTRRFAKRQETFFKRFHQIKWVHWDGLEPPESLAERIIESFNEMDEKN